MRSEEELREELAWYEEWSDADNINAECETQFDSSGYIEALRVVLGEEEMTRSVPPSDAVNKLIEWIRTQHPDADIQVERLGFPPNPDIGVRTFVGIEDVDEYMEVQENIRNRARHIEETYETDAMIYTYVDQKRDE